MITTQELLGRIAKIDWFSQVGKPINLDINIPYTQIFSWQEVETFCKSEYTRYSILEAKNTLTMHLSDHCRMEYREWNSWIHKFDEVFNSEILPLLRTKAIKPHLHDAVLHQIRSQLKMALMETVYGDCHSPPIFFQKLIPIYEAGHFPCGWEGEWPEGNLVIF